MMRLRVALLAHVFAHVGAVSLYMFPACLQTTDESMVPLLINCWPSASGGESYVNIEYESTTDFDLQNVAIAIPLPALSASPKVNQVPPVIIMPFSGMLDIWHRLTHGACTCFMSVSVVLTMSMLKTGTAFRLGASSHARLSCRQRWSLAAYEMLSGHKQRL